MQGITITQYTDSSQLPLLEPQWESLLEETRADPIFGSFCWNKTWWEVFKSQENSPFLLVFKKDSAVSGIAGFYKSNEKWGLWRKNVVKPLGVPPADYYDLLIPENSLRQVTESLFDFFINLKNWDVLSLNRIPEQSPNLECLVETAKRKNLSTIIEKEELCLYFRVKGSFESFISKRMDSKERMRYRRKEKNLGKIGQPRFELIFSPAEIEKALPLVAGLESRSWQGNEGFGIFNTPAKKEFFFNIAGLLAEQGKLAIHLFWLDSKLIAYNLGFIAARRYYWYNTAYDPEYHQYSPGKLSLMDLIERCFGMGIEVFDCMRGGHSYKARWADAANQNINLHIFAPSLKGRLMAAVFKSRLYLRGIKRKLKANHEHP